MKFALPRKEAFETQIVLIGPLYRDSSLSKTAQMVKVPSYLDCHCIRIIIFKITHMNKVTKQYDYIYGLNYKASLD